MFLRNVAASFVNPENVSIHVMVAAQAREFESTIRLRHDALN